MGWFSSSSSSDSSPTPAPTRQARKICWQHRDSYYDCLTKNSILIPPGTDMNDGKSAITKEEKEKEKLKSEKKLKERDTDPCVRERDGYEKNCASSWVDYFNKRRVLEERQRLMLASGAQPLSAAGRQTNEQRL